MIMQFVDDRDLIRAVIEERKTKMAQYLFQEAIDRGSEDNVSVVVIFFKCVKQLGETGKSNNLEKNMA
jgi:hypothetical protein